MKWIWTVAEGRCVHFARLIYTVFYVQGNYAFSGLRVRGVSAIQAPIGTCAIKRLSAIQGCPFWGAQLYSYILHNIWFYQICNVTNLLALIRIGTFGLIWLVKQYASNTKIYYTHGREVNCWQVHIKAVRTDITFLIRYWYWKFYAATDI